MRDFLELWYWWLLRVLLLSWVRWYFGIPFLVEVLALCPYYAIFIQLGQHQMTITFMNDNAVFRQGNVLYHVSCPVMQAGRHEQHSGSTICSKDFMSVSEAGWLLFIQLLQGKCGLERAELQNKICISLLTCYVALDWFLNCNETFLKSEVGDNNTNIRWL